MASRTPNRGSINPKPTLTQEIKNRVMFGRPVLGSGAGGVSSTVVGIRLATRRPSGRSTRASSWVEPAAQQQRAEPVVVELGQRRSAALRALQLAQDGGMHHPVGVGPELVGQRLPAVPDIDQAHLAQGGALSSVGKVALIGVAVAAAGAAAESMHLADEFDKATNSIAANAGISQKAAKTIGDSFLNAAGGPCQGT
ncbi:MAG: hypothetical protein ACRENX_02215 [Candidatus Dormibacteria bacterium]